MFKCPQSNLFQRFRQLNVRQLAALPERIPADDAQPFLQMHRFQLVAVEECRPFKLRNALRDGDFAHPAVDKRRFANAFQAVRQRDFRQLRNAPERTVCNLLDALRHNADRARRQAPQHALMHMVNQHPVLNRQQRMIRRKLHRPQRLAVFEGIPLDFRHAVRDADACKTAALECVSAQKLHTLRQVDFRQGFAVCKRRCLYPLQLFRQDDLFQRRTVVEHIRRNHPQVLRERDLLQFCVGRKRAVPNFFQVFGQVQRRETRPIKRPRPNGAQSLRQGDFCQRPAAAERACANALQTFRQAD